MAFEPETPLTAGAESGGWVQVYSTGWLRNVQYEQNTWIKAVESVDADADVQLFATAATEVRRGGTRSRCSRARSGVRHSGNRHTHPGN